MMTYEALGEVMKQTAAIRNFVGYEIYFGEQPRKAPSYITYWQVPGGPLLDNGIIASERWQVSCRSKDMATAHRLALEVQQCWQNYEGHVQKAVGDDGTLDGGTAESTFTDGADGGDAATSYTTTIEGAEDTFSIDRVNVRSAFMMKDPDAAYWHIPVDIWIVYYTTEQD